MINQREIEINSENTFISKDIKYKKKNLILIQNAHNNLNKCMNLLNNEINKISQILQHLNLLEQNRIYNNYNLGNNNSFNGIILEINNLQHEIENEINNQNNNNINSLISKIYSEIPDFNNNCLFIFPNYFNKRQGKNNTIYNLLKEKERKMIAGIFHNIKLNVINMITKDNRLNSISNINRKIIDKIVRNKDSHNFYKNKIIDVINTISKDDNKNKIDYLNILIVGRKGIGKTSLIKYILELREDDYIDNSNNDFIIYKSKQTKYLRIIEVKGIGNDADSTPLKIKEKIQNYINNSNSICNQDYNSVIHCIWYCIYGKRFENSEDTLFLELIKMFKGNIMPIILVYTKSIDSFAANEFYNEMKEDGIENEFIPVIGEDLILKNGKIKRAFGKKELISSTLKQCSKALKSDLLNIMIQQISNHIEID